MATPGVGNATSRWRAVDEQHPQWLIVRAPQQFPGEHGATEARAHDCDGVTGGVQRDSPARAILFQLPFTNRALLRCKCSLVR